MQKMKVAILKGNGVYRMGDAIYRKGIWRRVRRLILAGDEYDSTILKRYLLSKFDAYRTYKVKSMKNIRILLFEI